MAIINYKELLKYSNPFISFNAIAFLLVTPGKSVKLLRKLGINTRD